MRRGDDGRDPRAWLIEAESPGVRYLALRDILGVTAEDTELRRARTAAHRDGPIAAVLDAMDPAGFWVSPGPGYNPKYRATAWSIILLAQLGASADEDPRIARACDYVLDHSLVRGSYFTISGAPSGTVDCLQGNLCWSLLQLGVDPARLEGAMEWLARSVTGDGVAPLTEKDAPVRYYAYNCGPGFACGANDKLPCAWGAVKLMLALGRWPVERRTDLIERAIAMGTEFLLGTDPATAAYPSGYSAKPSRSWFKLGFPVFYVTDILQIVEALVQVGHGTDPRLANALAFIRARQDADGRWSLEYDYTGKTWADFGPPKQPNKWVTLRALRSLSAARTGG